MNVSLITFLIGTLTFHKMEPHDGIEPSTLLYQSSLLPLTPMRHYSKSKTKIVKFQNGSPMENRTPTH